MEYATKQHTLDAAQELVNAQRAEDPEQQAVHYMNALSCFQSAMSGILGIPEGLGAVVPSFTAYYNECQQFMQVGMDIELSSENLIPLP